jgi:hypothetical protein
MAVAVAGGHRRHVATFDLTVLSNEKAATSDSANGQCGVVARSVRLYCADVST